jgi:hypothetical protein
MSAWNREHATTLVISTAVLGRFLHLFYFCGEVNILLKVAGYLETFLTYFGKYVVCCTASSTPNNLSIGQANRATQES